MENRTLLAISIKHSEWKWKFGKPLILWGSRTNDEDKRSFGGYEENPYKAELYNIKDWEKDSKHSFMKVDEPVKMDINFCKKYKDYDTVLIQFDDYVNYCVACGFSYPEMLKQEEISKDMGEFLDLVEKMCECPFCDLFRTNQKAYSFCPLCSFPIRRTPLTTKEVLEEMNKKELEDAKNE